MMAKKAHPYRPKDINQLAKMIVDISTGEVTENTNPPQIKLPAKKKKAATKN